MTKTNTRKLLVVYLVVAMLITLMGCSTKNTPGDSEAPDKTEDNKKELIKVDMFNTYANYMGVQGGWYGKILKDKFNIELNIIAPNVAGTGDQLYQTRTAAGNLGDIIVQSKARMVDCYKTKLLMDLTPYLDKAPNLKRLQVAIDKFKEQTEGKPYAIPGRVSTSKPTDPAGRGRNPESAAYLRWDWYAEAGAPEIKNLDSLLDILSSIIEKHPTNKNGDKVYAFSLFKDWDGGSVRNARELLLLSGYGSGQGFYWMNYDGSKVVSLTDDNGLYYQALKMYNKAYKMGILDPDSSTQNYDMCSSKVKDGRVLYVWWPWIGGTIHDRFDMANIPFAMVPVTESVVYNAGYNPYGQEGLAFAIGANAKNPERLVEFLDWYASPEGVLISNGHVEGVTFEMANGKPKLTEFGLNNALQNLEAPAEYGGGLWKDGGCQINYPLIHPDDENSVIGEPTNSNLWTTTIESNSNEYNKKWEEIYGISSPLEYLKSHSMIQVAPGTAYTPPSEPSDITTARAQINELFVAASWKMIYANSDSEFESLWKEVKKQMPDFGLNKVMEYDMNIVKEMAAARRDTLANAK